MAFGLLTVKKNTLYWFLYLKKYFVPKIDLCVNCNFVQSKKMYTDFNFCFYQCCRRTVWGGGSTVGVDVNGFKENSWGRDLLNLMRNTWDAGHCRFNRFKEDNWGRRFKDLKRTVGIGGSRNWVKTVGVEFKRFEEDRWKWRVHWIFWWKLGRRINVFN